MKHRRSYVLGALLFYSSLDVAWNAEGHRVIARIAEKHMTPHALLRFRALNQVLQDEMYTESLANAAVWLDTLRGNRMKATRAMHYIDIPFSKDNTALSHIQPQPLNAVLSVREARAVLESNEQKPLEQAISLRILLHVVGDLHQPLHAANRISKAYPLGDRGGNLEKIPKNKVARNLHAYWDRGAGVLLSSNKTPHTLQPLSLQCNPKQMNTNPMYWATESHQIAKVSGYPLSRAIGFTHMEQQKIQKIVEERLFYAGCRLAAVLNEIDEKRSA